MTPARSKPESVARAVLIAVATSLLGAILLSATTLKEDAAAHTADVASIRATHAADVSSLEVKVQRILDLLCDDRPKARACHQ